MKKSLLLTAAFLLFSFSLLAQDALVIVNGKKIKTDVNSIDPNTIESVSVLKDKAALDAYGREGENGVIIIKTKNSIDPNVTKSEPLVLVDGKEYTKGIKSLDPNNIESMSVLKDQSAQKKYGEAGKNGVIEITTKSTITK